MSRIDVSIWGRVLDLEVSIKKYSYQTELETQKQTANNLHDIPFDDSLEGVKSYILANNEKDIHESINNIYKYIKPRKILIPREEGIVIMLCDYIFDLEHGIAIVFENCKFKMVCGQDEVL